jgi:hypothetical protein
VSWKTEIVTSGARRDDGSPLTGVQFVPTLDVRKEPLEANQQQAITPTVTLNYSSILEFTPDMRQRLIDSTRLVVSILQTCRGILATLVVNGTHSDRVAEILKFHFGMERDDTHAVTRLKRNFGLLDAGLSAAYTISDHRARFLSQFVAENKTAIEEASGKTFATSAALVTSLCAEDGWGKDASFWALSKRLYYRGVLHALVNQWDLSFDEDVEYGEVKRMVYPLIRNIRQAGTFDNEYRWPEGGEDPLTTEIKKTGSIHIDFGQLLNPDQLAQHANLHAACIIIHEASHKFALTADFAYAREQQKYANLSTAQKLNNADSYGYACISLYKDKLIKFRKDIKTI